MILSRSFLSVAVLLASGLLQSAVADNAPDDLIVTGPLYKQVPVMKLLVTPPGKPQQTLGAALSGSGGSGGGTGGAVSSVNGQTGDVTLGVGNIAGAAPLSSPNFTGAPTAPTPTSSDNSTALATTAYVKTAVAGVSGGGGGGGAVSSVAGRMGDVILGVTDVFGAAPLASPVLTGNPTAPTATAGNNTNSVATTSFVTNAVAGVTSGGGAVSSVAGRTGAVTLGVADISGAATSTSVSTEATARASADALLAPRASPAFTGSPTAPTPTAGDNTTNLATTAFVTTAVSGVSGGGGAVSSVAGRTGAVTLGVADVSGAAPLASPALTGNPTAPTATAGDNDTSVATTAFTTGAVASEATARSTADALLAPKASPTFTGVPAAPTATAGTNTTQLATTAFVTGAVSASTTGVSSVNTRTGAVTLSLSDISGAAPLASPSLTGTPTAPTASSGTNTTQVATTAFVATAVAAGGGGGGSSGPAFLVKSYGANCDGQITLGGVTVTSGSPTISDPSHSFTSADIGATINLSVPTLNSHSASALTSFSSTIASVSGGNATLAANATFSSTAAGARWYHTVDTTAIQAALDAANAVGGGIVEFPPGVCATGALVFYSNERIVGSSMGATTVLLANGSNSDMFVGVNFSSLVGTENSGGVRDFSFQNIQLDGNRGANTGSGIGTPTGTGDGIRVYGYEFTTDNLLVNNFAADGFYPEWSNTAGSPLDSNNNIGPDGMENHIHDTKFAYNAGNGIVWNGPHDGVISHVTTLSNGTGGIFQINSDKGSPIHIDHYHGYQNGGPDLTWYSSMYCDACTTEGTMLLRGFNYRISNTFIGTLQLGVEGDSAVYQLSVNNTDVTTINNITGSWFNDTWTGGSVGSITGAAYTPFNSYGTIGLPNQVDYQFQVRHFNSWPVVMQTGTDNVFRMFNGGVQAYTMDISGNAVHEGTVTAPSYVAGSTAGVTCSGTPTSSFASVGGIVTHC